MVRGVSLLPFMLLEQRDPLAGLEIAKSNADIAKQCRQRIFSQMIETRGNKYRLFLQCMRSMKYLACQPTRGELLESMYALMRYVDDVVDGDTPLPNGYASAAEFVQRKIDFAHEPKQPQDAPDKLLLHCVDLARQIGDDLSSETDDILRSLHFDAVRRNPSNLRSVPRSELQHHFHLLDIRGTIGACLKLAREKGVTDTDLQALGNASRIHYTLRDFEDDIRAGFNNVPTEDAETIGISDAELRDRSSPGVREWFEQEATRGMAMLSAHRKEIPKMPLRRLTKTALWWTYERPAKRFFQHVLRQK